MSSLHLERWARQAYLLERQGNPVPIAASRRVLDDIGDLKALQRAEWLHRARALREDPTALNGVYAGLNAIPPSADLSTKTSIVGEVGLLSAAEIALFMPILNNGLTSPQTFQVYVSGNYTTAATPGNLTITPRMGTSASGATLGATGANALTASITAGGFELKGRLTIRSLVNTPGANSVAVGMFAFEMTNVALGTAGTLAINTKFGHTAASFDATSAAAATGGGLWFGLTHTVTTVTYTPKQVIWGSWN